jgi:putative ABC transport system ATP-binding protein
VTAVEDFDLTLEAGSLVALHGPSGSGKTAVVHLLAGWEQPDRGTISWPGATGRPPSWSEVAVIPQTLALLDELTVVENITLPLRASDHRRPPRLDATMTETLERLGLAHRLERLVDRISVGEHQRVMIARALAMGPAVILADEPAGHQDDRNASVIAGLLLEAATQGAACLIATRQTSIPAPDGRLVGGLGGGLVGGPGGGRRGGLGGGLGGGLAGGLAVRRTIARVPASGDS